MSTSSIFKFESAEVRTFADERNELWFLANDVCSVLGYANPRKTVADHCKEKGVTKRYTPTESGNQEMTFINEGNLYRLIVKSRKPEAERFEEWVMDEVLPTIRKTGKYETPYSVGKTDTLTKDEQDYLRGLVKAHVETLPKEQQGGAAIKMWSKLKSHFGVAYRDIPRHEFAEAVSLLTRATLPEPTAALSLPELFASKRWLVHMTAEGHLVWNEIQPDMVILSMSDMTKAVGKAWWGAVDTLADLNRICGKTGQKFDIPRQAA
jgi:prophage antirepressor-like protein